MYRKREEESRGTTSFYGRERPPPVERNNSNSSNLFESFEYFVHRARISRESLETFLERVRPILRVRWLHPSLPCEFVCQPENGFLPSIRDANRAEDQHRIGLAFVRISFCFWNSSFFVESILVSVLVLPSIYIYSDS